ncbi:MAG: aspartyl/glutamyl-tRNA amidotransferase subunit C [Candidatus Nomurabacteria bacterium]|nr:aspartyl/glutamyl-tRNA amidotransferase subunit C [Candidatus Nomurabacteria bacterium]
MDIEVIKKLALMARIDMDEKEMKEIGDSFGPILSYVGQIQEVSETLDMEHGEVTDEPINILREDIVTNKASEYTDKILKQAPARENGFLKVKQIL